MSFTPRLIYRDLPFARKNCAFSPKKPTKRQKFYISGRSRFAHITDTTAIVSVMNMNSFTQLTLFVTVNQVENPSVKSIFSTGKNYPCNAICLLLCCKCLRLFQRPNWNLPLQLYQQFVKEFPSQLATGDCLVTGVIKMRAIF